MDRTSIGAVTDSWIGARVATKKDKIVRDHQAHEGDILLYRQDTKEVVASINCDDIFDQFGNRFQF